MRHIILDIALVSCFWLQCPLFFDLQILERMTGVTDEWTKPSVAYPEPVHLTFQDPDVPGAEQGAEGRDDPGLGQSRWNDDDDDDDMFGGPRY